MKINSTSVWLHTLNSVAMYNLTDFTFMVYMATQPPYQRVCDIFFMYDKFYVMALSSKQYTNFKEPPIKGYHITATVFIFKEYFINFKIKFNIFSV